jgi:eukaryotic-like serine/threonine-protein kinase
MGQHLLPGNVLAGKFRVERVIGEGGMGMVVAAHHLQLDQRVALKVMRPEAAVGAEGVQRFLREAQAVAKLRSSHVVRVLDVGALPDGAPYIVMEFLEGHDLAAHVYKRGGLPIEEAVDYVLQACDALSEAHRLGIVHRDLKPANLFLTNDGGGVPIIKILDFGISKQTSLDEGRADLTSTRGVVGSPSYMSPEQLKASRDVDGRTDIWALGVVLHELLTARVAFEATTLPELHVAILSQPPSSVRMIRADVPPGLEAVLLRCLEKDVSRRYQSVTDLVAALADFAPPHARGLVDKLLRGPHSAMSRVGEASAHGFAPGTPYGQPTPAGGAGPGGYGGPGAYGTGAGGGTPTPMPMAGPGLAALPTYPSAVPIGAQNYPGPGMVPYNSTGGISGAGYPPAFQQTHGYGAPPENKGPSIVLILIVLGLVIAVAAFVLFCGVVFTSCG